MNELTVNPLDMKNAHMEDKAMLQVTSEVHKPIRDEDKIMNANIDTMIYIANEHQYGQNVVDHDQSTSLLTFSKIVITRVSRSKRAAEINIWENESHEFFGHLFVNNLKRVEIANGDTIMTTLLSKYSDWYNNNIIRNTLISTY